MRTVDADLVRNAVGLYDTNVVGLDPEQWVGNPANVALTNEEGDVALFERQWRLPSSVCGHYFFKSRGRAAIDAALQMLEEIFTGPYGVQTIIGLTPLDNRPALWMNRKIGFTSGGVIDTEIGPCELVILTKDRWRNQEED